MNPDEKERQEAVLKLTRPEEPLIDRLDDFVLDESLVSGEPNVARFPPEYKYVFNWAYRNRSYQVKLLKNEFLIVFFSSSLGRFLANHCFLIWPLTIFSTPRRKCKSRLAFHPKSRPLLVEVASLDLWKDFGGGEENNCGKNPNCCEMHYKIACCLFLLIRIHNYF